jgi:preprotein translocase subunit SecE
VANKRTTKKAPKKKPTKQQAVQKKQPRGIRLFYRETMGELRKVSWPTRTEALGLTRVVIIVMILMSILLGGLDWGFFNFFNFLFSL